MDIEKHPYKFIYVCNKGIYRIFKKWYIISILFSTKYCNFIHLCSYYTFFINHALKFKYPPQ